MFKQICLIVLVSTLIDKIVAESPCGDWLNYRDEKCFKVIDSLTTEEEAETICQKEHGATLGLPQSKGEQDLIYDHLDKSNFAKIWIGVKISNLIARSLDGSFLKYWNWAKGTSVINHEDLQCVGISMMYLGKWVNVNCDEKSRVLCEKRVELPKSKIEIILEELIRNYTNKFTSLENEINYLGQNPVPIGFTYVQLFGQSEPHTLWPNTQWDNVSKKYAGFFFRAEGGGSNVFGQIQEQQTQSFEIKDDKCGYNCLNTVNGDSNTKEVLRITNEYPLKGLWKGGADGNGMGIKLKHNSEEVRPRNQAIRIWIRIK